MHRGLLRVGLLLLLSSLPYCGEETNPVWPLSCPLADATQQDHEHDHMPAINMANLQAFMK
jgi:hypothetical protein